MHISQLPNFIINRHLQKLHKHLRNHLLIMRWFFNQMRIQNGIEFGDKMTRF
jgi:hypothetical protein